MKQLITLLFICIIPSISTAQTATGNDFLSNMGKIYVVVGVLLIVFICIVGFLIYLERKVAKLEQEIK